MGIGGVGVKIFLFMAFVAILFINAEFSRPGGLFVHGSSTVMAI